MFWHLSAASSPVELILDRQDFSLDQLLDEDEIIQECKALNTHLINFLRDRAQVEQLLRYIVEEAPEDADSKRSLKFPYIACEIFACEIDVILRTLVEEEELMSLLFSFLEPRHSRSNMLAGYFSKVVVCLMLRKMTQLMNYVQAHREVIPQLVDLIGITSIMEVLVRLVGADDHTCSNFMDVVQWLANGNLLETVVDKLKPSNPPEVHANAATVLCAVTQNAPSALASKLSSPSCVARIFDHALEGSQSRSALVHSLSVCISLIDPKRLSSPSLHSIQRHSYESPGTVNPETVTAMLPNLGDLLMLLNVSFDENILPTSYGELRPPLGKHRLKIVEFFSVLLRTGNEFGEKELICVGAIQRILDLFFEYPFHNALHHLVEGIISSCLESKNSSIVDHLFHECNIVEKVLQLDRHPILSSDTIQPTVGAPGKQAPQVGNLGHITRICNNLLQQRNGNSQIQAYLQENMKWIDWETTVLQKRNAVENVYHWACGRPTALQDKTRESDEDDIQERDYDVGALPNNLSMAFRYNMYENDDTEEGHGSRERDDEDVYFDDDSTEVVISSLRLGDDHASLFTNSNWFAFEGEQIGNDCYSISENMSEINLNAIANACSSSSMVREDDELVDSSRSVNGTSRSGTSVSNDNPTREEVMLSLKEKAGAPGGAIIFPIVVTNHDSTGSVNGTSWSGTSISNDNPTREKVMLSSREKAGALGGVSIFPIVATNNESLGDRPSPDWVGLHEIVDTQAGGSDGDLSGYVAGTGFTPNSLWNDNVKQPNDTASPMVNDGSVGTGMSCRASMPSLFEEGVEFVGVEPEGTEMELALKGGTVREAGPLKKSSAQVSEKSREDIEGMLKFNDMNYWRVEQEVTNVEQ